MVSLNFGLLKPLFLGGVTVVRGGLVDQSFWPNEME